MDSKSAYKDYIWSLVKADSLGTVWEAEASTGATLFGREKLSSLDNDGGRILLS